MQKPEGLIKTYKFLCLNYLEQLKFKENGFNEVDIVYDMKGIMHLLDVLEDTSSGSVDTLMKFREEEAKIYWNFGFRI